MIFFKDRNSLLIILLLIISISANNLRTLSGINCRFASKLYEALIKSHPRDNIIFSPISVTSLFSILLKGSHHMTRNQILDTFGIEDNINNVSIHEIYHSLLDNIKNGESNYTLLFSNNVFVDSGVELSEEFINNTIMNYHGLVEELDFLESPVKSLILMNEWVSNRTNGLIDTLLPQESVTSMSQLIIISAAIFKAQWMHPFNPEKTQILPFNLAPNVAEDMVMMKTKNYFSYASLRKLKSKLIEIPYANNYVSLYIILPDAKDDLSVLEDNLNFDDINNVIRNAMHLREITLIMPMFKMIQNIHLRSILARMGLKDIFSPSKSDLSKLSSSAELFVSELVHSITLEFTEIGTEATSALSQHIGLSATREIDFLIDRPFMFFIRHNPSQSILFMGRIIKPPRGKDSIGEFLLRREKNTNNSNVNHSSIQSLLQFITLIMFIIFYNINLGPFIPDH